MIYKLKAILLCPSTRSKNLDVNIFKYKRDKNTHRYNGSELRKSDKIIDGLIINNFDSLVYPIVDGIPILLSVHDMPKKFYEKKMKDFIHNYDVDDLLKKLIEKSINSFLLSKKDKNSDWNKEEMEYYDNAVSTKEKRDIFAKEIKNKPLHNIFLPRQNNITDHIKNKVSEKLLLEVGSGNSRTIHWILNPEKYNYDYIGTDISFKRLLLAQSVIPNSSFIQCSAINLPFKNCSVDYSVGFGVYHHLQEPLLGIKEATRIVKLGGLIGMHEPIIKPLILSDNSKIKKFFEDYEHSEHDNEIDSKKTIEYFFKIQCSILKIKYSITIINVLTNHFFKYISFIRKSRTFNIIMIFIDDLMIKTLCKIFPSFGPSAVSILVKKDNNEATHTKF